MTRIELSRLSPEEKDALILALLERVAALEAKLNRNCSRGWSGGEDWLTGESA